MPESHLARVGVRIGAGVGVWMAGGVWTGVRVRVEVRFRVGVRVRAGVPPVWVARPEHTAVERDADVAELVGRGASWIAVGARDEGARKGASAPG